MDDATTDFTVDGTTRTLTITDIAPTFVFPRSRHGRMHLRLCEFDIDDVTFSFASESNEDYGIIDESYEPAEDWDGLSPRVQEQVAEALSYAFDEIDGRLDNTLDSLCTDWAQDGLDSWAEQPSITGEEQS